MRGDRPVRYTCLSQLFSFTPHARGSTESPESLSGSQSVYPACAGIDPMLCVCGRGMIRLPRMRGDRPYAQQLRDEKAQFTPHARGSTLCSAAAR